MLKRISGAAIAGLLSIAFGLGVSGCTIAPVDKSFSLAGKANTGVVYLSLTRVGSVESSMWLKLRGVGHSYSGFVTLDDHGVKRDWAKLTFSGRVNDFGRATVEEPVGYLAAFALPAGDYEFYAWYGQSPVWNAHGDDYDIASQAFSVKFTVQPGAVTYAGNLQITVPDNIYADARKGSFQIAVSDQQARDHAVLQQKYANLGGQSSATVVMNSPNAGQPLTFWTWPTTGPTRNGSGGYN
jgi:hypothetical protein